jgi:hypothetical protein
MRVLKKIGSTEFLLLCGALRMTCLTPLRPAHGMHYLQMSNAG